MTISPISELSSMFGQNINPVNTSNQDGSDFQTMMDNVTKKSEETSSYIKDLPMASSRMDDNNKTEYKDTVKKDSATDKLKQADDKSQGNVKDNKDSDSLSVNHKDVTDSQNIKDNSKVTGELKDKILNEAAEDLGIDVEELMDILATLGLTAADLVNPENVSMLVASVKADGDMMALVTDENLTNIVMNLNEAIAGLVNESADALNVSSDVLKDMVLAEKTEVYEGELPASEKVPVTDNTAVPVVKNPGEDKVIVKAGDLEEMVETDDINSGETGVLTAEEDVEENTDRQESSDNKSDNGSGQENKSLNHTVNNNINQIFTDNQQPEIQDIKTVENPRYVSVDQQEIIDQVRENIKANVKADVTEISMQLNPESLGSVGLTVSAREGNVTAYLTTQNESVQAALESQIAMLKETLEQQGVKVEAIEVAVGAHEFEQNLEQGNDRNDAQEKMAAELKKATRKLNINDILADDIIEGLDEADVVTAKMMAADGTQMDYKV